MFYEVNDFELLLRLLKDIMANGRWTRTMHQDNELQHGLQPGLQPGLEPGLQPETS